MRGNGKQVKSGAQTYRCKCGFSCTEGDRPAHPPTIDDQPMSQVERNRRYRQKKKANLVAINNKSPDKSNYLGTCDMIASPLINFELQPSKLTYSKGRGISNCPKQSNDTSLP